MKCSIPDIRITGIAAAVPKAELGLGDLAREYGEAEVRRIVRATGIESVRVAGQLTTGDLCLAAARHLLERTNVDPESVDAIILATQTPDRLMPATSVLLQDRLGLSEDVVAFDINYGCSGYVFGLYLAGSLLAGGCCRRVLVCTGDVTTQLLRPEDRNVRMLFGDAATATLIDRGTADMHLLMRTDSRGADHLTTRIMRAGQSSHSFSVGFLEMDGAEVMGFALREVPRLIRDVLEFAKMPIEQVELFALHQANGFMLQQLRRILSLSESRVPIAMKHFGNTGPSSIPLLLASTRAGTPLPPAVLMCGFGVGLSYGAALVDLSECIALMPIEVDGTEPGIAKSFL